MAMAGATSTASDTEVAMSSPRIDSRRRLQLSGGGGLGLGAEQPDTVMVGVSTAPEPVKDTLEAQLAGLKLAT